MITIRNPYDEGLKKDFVLTSEPENHLQVIFKVCPAHSLI